MIYLSQRALQLERKSTLDERNSQFDIILIFTVQMKTLLISCLVQLQY